MAEFYADVYYRYLWDDEAVECANDEVAELPRYAPIKRGTVSEQRKAIIKQVGDRHGLHYSYFENKSRSEPFVKARHEAYYRLRKELGLSFSRIGHLSGGRDHSTAHHGYNRHRERLLADKMEKWLTQGRAQSK